MLNEATKPKATAASSGGQQKIETEYLFTSLYNFLRENYLHSRFEGSLNRKDFPDYPKLVTQSSMDQLRETGIGFISMYESRSGRVIIFNADLNILNPDEPPAQIQRTPGRLTHITS